MLALTRSAFVTNPVALKAVVTVNEAIVGEDAKTTLPTPVVPNSPRTPALLNSIDPGVPLRMVVVPTVIDAAVAVTEHEAPSAQLTPLIVTLELARSTFVTNPTAVKEPVTDRFLIVGPFEATKPPVPVAAAVSSGPTPAPSTMFVRGPVEPLTLP